MTRRAWMLGVTVLTLTAGVGVWARLAWAETHTRMKTVDCCLDPTCPPGCSEVCPPDCLTGLAGAGTRTAARSDCCADPTCPPGCSPDCPPDCLDLAAKAKCLGAASPDAKGKTFCPPCPFCP